MSDITDNTDITEKILSQENHSYTLFPLQYKELFNLYKKALASFWTVEEIDLSKDANDWKNLNSWWGWNDWP